MNFDQVMGNLEQLFAAELGYLHRVVNPYEMESETTVSNKIVRNILDRKNALLVCSMSTSRIV